MVKHIDKKIVLWQAMISQKQQRELDSLFETGEDLHILIMNVEALSTQKGLTLLKNFYSHIEH